MKTKYVKGERVKVIGRLDSNSCEWKGTWTSDMWHTINRNPKFGRIKVEPHLTVVKDHGLKKGVYCHDGNYWPHRVLEDI